MSSFSAEAAYCFCLAAKCLGWKPDDFWSSTPAEFTSAMQSPDLVAGGIAPDREQIQKMLERDTNG